MAGIKGIYIYNEAGEVIGATGGKLAALKNLQKDPDFYKKMGAKGGVASGTGGYASEVIGEDGLTGKQRAVVAGRKGGTISRRKPRNETK